MKFHDVAEALENGEIIARKFPTGGTRFIRIIDGQLQGGSLGFTGIMWRKTMISNLDVMDDNWCVVKE